MKGQQMRGNGPPVTLLKQVNIVRQSGWSHHHLLPLLRARTPGHASCHAPPSPPILNRENRRVKLGPTTSSPSSVHTHRATPPATPHRPLPS